MSKTIYSVEGLELIVRGIVLAPKPDPKELLDTTMRVLAEGDRLESEPTKAKPNEKGEI